MSKYRKSAQQLADVIPYVALLIVGGHVNVLFPGSRPSRYSEFVVLSPSKGPYPSVVPEGLSLFFDGEQWNDLVVPLLQEVQTSGWRGNLPGVAGETVKLLQAIYGPGGTLVAAEGTPLGTLPGSEVAQPGPLYQPEPYVEELQVRTYQLALVLGY